MRLYSKSKQLQREVAMLPGDFGLRLLLLSVLIYGLNYSHRTLPNHPPYKGISCFLKFLINTLHVCSVYETLKHERVTLF